MTRVDARAKVTGQAKYPGDFEMPGQLWMKVLFADRPHARIKRLVFGANDPKTGACGSVMNLFAGARLNHHTLVRGGVLADESGRLLSSFFAERRELKRAGSLPADEDDDDAP